jgi:hypothetical protein
VNTKRVAYHEAGHVVAELVTGADYAVVTFKFKKGVAETRGYGDKPKSVERAATCFAGMYAQARGTKVGVGICQFDSDGSDMEQARNVCNDDRDSLLAADRLARSIVHDHWHVVEAIASVLLTSDDGEKFDRGILERIKP